MKIHLRLFASLREAVNLSTEVLYLNADIKTIEELRQQLRLRGEVWAQAFSPERPIRAALNQQMVDFDVVLVDGGEVAFFPPVTGG